MRPTVGESIAGIRRILTDVILPEVTSPYATWRADEVVGALQALETRWAEVYPLLMEENDDLHVLFSGALPLLDQAQDARPSTELRTLQRRIREQVGREASGDRKYPSYDALEATNLGYKTLMADAVHALEAVAGTHAGDPNLGAFRARLRAHMRTYLDR